MPRSNWRSRAVRIRFCFSGWAHDHQKSGDCCRPRRGRSGCSQRMPHARDPVSAASAVQPSRGGERSRRRNTARAVPKRTAIRWHAIRFPAFSGRGRRLAAGRGSGDGARLGVPEKLVPHVSASRSGSRWTSTQGQIQVETFRLTEAALPALFDEEKKACAPANSLRARSSRLFRYCRRSRPEELYCSCRRAWQRGARRHHPLRPGHRRHHGPLSPSRLPMRLPDFPIPMRRRRRDCGAWSNMAPRSWWLATAI